MTDQRRYLGSLEPAPFIVGVGRSGTTLLRLMLDSHPQLALPSETHFIPDLVRRLGTGDVTHEAFAQYLSSTPTWQNFRMSLPELLASLEQKHATTVPEALRCFFSLYAEQRGKHRWGDKTPPYRGAMNAIAEVLPEAHFIHLIRDGRDVCLSYRGLWFGPGDSVEKQARFWVEQINIARRAARSLRSYIEIKYEALVERPEESLHQLCDYLSLRYSEAMLRFHVTAQDRVAEVTKVYGPLGSILPDVTAFHDIHRHTASPPDPRRIGRWRVEMTRDERERYEAIAGDLLKELGYLI